MFNSRESKLGLIRSLITSTIFLVFLKPIVEFVWNVIVKISNATYSNFIDSIYKNSSLGQRNWVDFIIILFLSLGLLTSINTKFISLLNRISFIKLKNKIKTKSETDIEKVKEIKNILERKIKNSNKIYNFLIDSRKMLILLVIIWNLIFFSFIFSIYADLQLNASFNQRLNVINPYTSEMKIKILKSKWASMQTRKDFEKIDNQIDSIGRANKIVLPENLLK